MTSEDCAPAKRLLSHVLNRINRAGCIQLKLYHINSTLSHSFSLQLKKRLILFAKCLMKNAERRIERIYE